MEVNKIMRPFEFSRSVSNVLIILSTSISSWSARVGPYMRTLLTLRTNSSTPRRHGSGQNNENIPNIRGQLEHYFVHFHVFVECSSLPLVLVMFSLFCPLPCLRGVLEFGALHEDMDVHKIMRTLLTLGANSSTPRRHGSGQNNEKSLPLVLVMFSLFCPLPCLLGVLELAPSVNNVLIILCTSNKIMRTLLTLGANSSTPRRHGSGQNN
jgi:hypothetical protein